MIKCSKKNLDKALRALKKRFGKNAEVTLEQRTHELALHAFDDTMRARVSVTLLPTSDKDEALDPITVKLGELHAITRGSKNTREVELSIERDSLTLTCRGSEHVLTRTNHVVLADTREGGEVARVSATLLANTIATTTPLTSKDSAHPNLCHVSFEADRIMAANTSMAFIKKRAKGERWPLEPGEGEQVVLLADDLALLGELMTHHPCDCEVYPDAATFSSKGFDLSLSRLDGTYPDLEALLTTNTPESYKELTVARARLLTMLEESKPHLSRARQLYLRLTSGRITPMIEQEDGCLWEGEQIEATHACEGFLSVSFELFAMLLRAFDGARHLTLNLDPTSPLKGVTVARKGGASTRIFLMPMHPSSAMKRRFDIQGFDIAA